MTRASSHAASSSKTREGYVTSRDGIKLFYTIKGSGPPIILCHGLSVSFIHWKYLAPALAKHYRVIQWNYRGHGKSGTPSEHTRVTLYHLVEDLEQLRAHLRIPHCALLGHSMGSQVILEYFRQYPNHVAALLPVLGTYERPFTHIFDHPASKHVFNALYWLARFRHPGVIAGWNFVHINPFRVNYHFIRALGIIHPKKCSWEDIGDYFEHYKRVDMMQFFELAKSAQEHSAADVLKSIDVPTLVVGGGSDRFTPVALSRTMADNIPGSEYFEVPDGSHAALLEEPAMINKRIIDFLAHTRNGKGWKATRYAHRPHFTRNHRSS